MGNLFSNSGPGGVLLRHKRRLEDMIESRFELTGQLATCDVLGYREIAELRAISSVYLRSGSLLDLIANKPPSAYEHFMTALELTGQKHVANFIRHNGERDLTTVGEDWPLEFPVLARIYHNLLFLEEKIDAEGGLVESLLASDVLTHQQSMYVKESRPSQKAAELVNMITRRSFAHLRQFIQCLYSNGQSHVAKVLEEGGVVTCVEIQLQLPNDSKLAASTAQSTVIHRIHHQCHDKSDERQLIKAFMVLGRHGIEVLDAKPGSVRLYLWCRSGDALLAHRRLCDSGELKEVVETWFTDILDTAVTVQLIERRQDVNCSLSLDSSPSPELWSNVTETQSDFIQKPSVESTLFNNLYNLKPIDVKRDPTVADTESRSDVGRAVTVARSSVRFQDVRPCTDSSDGLFGGRSQPVSPSGGCSVGPSRRPRHFLDF